ncbi:PspC domain-containing protein [Undibacterium sp. LX40W]|uniref:PspC domain-containing protein n=1 Tax=Undibacterium nitidum TaxID=2762298 RepID=A0A923KRZ7_9BURK|nr:MULTISPECIES: PspC domain-containing protein [Undibacterium]MBC3879914.1 PspC domain-containing protein [Undibacterium nitidum]MBC3891350.1 PspC domain-containing protein [Undibacterium sp. LX40W]
MNIADEIARLHELHRSGALTDEEFAAAKEKVLASASTSSSGFGSGGTATNDNPFANLNHLRRSKHNQWIGGVCAGLGKFSGLEAWIWRLMFVLFVSAFGFGFVAYLLAWVFIPEEE